MKSTYDTSLGLYIGGEWLTSEGRDTRPVLNPATGNSQADLPLATLDDLDRALEATEGLSREKVDEMIRPALEHPMVTLNNLRPIRTAADLRAILELAWSA
ncbi:hypothetical protein [Paraburkholderia panacisoli]|uniref:hypothetical protein n=1 Tax=Paraburkholderia panacisoli TaxID=2603818 RepID=UPI00165F6889|nr:hypothetical protein [Paraburkholderia panacisoli]